MSGNDGEGYTIYVSRMGPDEYAGFINGYWRWHVMPNWGGHERGSGKTMTKWGAKLAARRSARLAAKADSTDTHTEQFRP